MKQQKKMWNYKIMAEVCFLLFLVLYPMRHVNWGLDLWDTGYNYANFTYMGLEHMDPMWLFSTYLANATGHLFTLLPFGNTLIGLNVYTGLFVSLLALLGYWFCRIKLKMPAWVCFVGEVAAVSLCWCPTALLYNYLTYVLFLGCVILLYIGLTEHKKWLLFAAGACLGTNLFVRISNLPQAAMILAVWGYAVIEGLEGRTPLRASQKETAKQQPSQETARQEAVSQEAVRQKTARQKGLVAGILAQAARQTLWCCMGYLSAVVVFLGWIHLRYGLASYGEGIRSLFSMTETATDYKPVSMLTGIIVPYMDMIYWIVRILVFVLAGMVICAVAGLVGGLVKSHGKKRAGNAIKLVSVVACVTITTVMIYWLFLREYTSFYYYSYDSMYRPTILFMILAMVMGVISIFQPGCPKQEKLLGGMVILVLLLTSFGSNNNVYPSINNLFVAAPYTLWQAVCFTKWSLFSQKQKGTWKLCISPLPVKLALWAMLCLFFLQGLCFGAVFTFAEATGVQDVSSKVTNNKVLAGVKMSPERAQWMTELSAYVEERGLQGREVLLYGQLPALSFYLQMPSAFNPWSDLRSYSLAKMEQDMSRLQKEIDIEGKESPVVIAENGVKQSKDDAKWQLIQEFMEAYGYEETFLNEKFTVWE